jgi:hypothetical protein
VLGPGWTQIVALVSAFVVAVLARPAGPGISGCRIGGMAYAAEQNQSNIGLSLRTSVAHSSEHQRMS